MFHLTTHAFFKALLFLGAGSVIVAHAPRAGHLEDGRAAQEDAGHLLDLHRRARWRCAGCRRSAASTARTASSPRPPQHNLRLARRGRRRRRPHDLLHVPPASSSPSSARPDPRPPATRTNRRQVMLWPLRILAVLSVDRRLHRHRADSTASNSPAEQVEAERLLPPGS